MIYSVAILKNNWIEDTSIIYIGKTDNSLRKRIRTYLRHGMGYDASHRGGRAIWQLPDAADLMIAWRPLPSDADAREVEIAMMDDFLACHGKLPFANMNK